jgi:long-chain acyl-CoA synthetase
MQTLCDLQDAVIGKYGSRRALVFTGEDGTWGWSYAELGEQTGRVAAWLAGQGVGPGARVILWAGNSPWWVAAYFAVLRLGGAVVPLDVRSAPDFVRRVAGQTTPALALLDRATAPGWPDDLPSRALDSLADLPPAPAPPVPADLNAGTLAVIAFTSGTTGEPKGVMLTHGNLVANAASVGPLVPGYPAYRLLSVLPLSHMLEQLIGLLVPLSLGGSVTYPASRQSTVLFRAIQEQQITALLLVPEALELLMEAIEGQVAAAGQSARWAQMQRVAALLPARGRRLLFRPVHQRFGGHLNFLCCGGARLAPELIQKWALLGVPVLQGYGTTEASPVISIETLRNRRLDAVGKPIPGMQVRIAADGEIQVKGPNVTPGYWHNPQATAAAFTDGWYKTGDLGAIDEDGFLFIKGRSQDRIVLASGQKVYPEDVEGILKAIPGVADATVIAMPGAHGPAVHAVVIPTSATTDVPAVVRQANGRLGTHQQIRGYSVWPDPDFPRTALQKVKKHAVLAMLLERSPAPAPAAVGAAVAPPPDGRAGDLLRLTARVARVDMATLSPEATLGEGAGLDSLRQIELLAAVEREMGAHVDEAYVGPTTTLRELLALIEHEPGAPPPGGSARRPQNGLATMLTRRTASPPRPLRVGPARWYQTAFRLFARALFAAVFRVRVGGRRNLPAGPVVLCMNHVGWADLFTPLLFLPPKPRFYVLGEEQVKYLSGFRIWLIDHLEIFIPLDRSKPLEALNGMADVVRRGGSLLVYPEGVVSHTEGELQALQEGAAHVAILTGAPLVPGGMTGAAELWLGKRLTLRVGRPIRPQDFVGTLEERREAMTHELAAAMRALLPGEPPQGGRKLLLRRLTHLF